MGLAAAAALACAASTLADTEVAGDRYWPQWRGPQSTGVSAHADPPIEWSESENIRWKVEIAGRGKASPIVWGDRLYLLSAVPVGAAPGTAHTPMGAAPRLPVHRFVVLAIDRHTGRTVWERTVREETPHEGAHHQFGTWASSSAVTDGEHVIAYFESRGVHAFDMDGHLRWSKDLGRKQMRNQFGEGASPALHGNRVVIVWDHQGQSMIVTLDKHTGEEMWRANRNEIDTWATPLIVEHDGRAQIVTSAQRRLRSYDLETGQVIWETDGVTRNPIPSPVAGDGMVFVMSGYRGNSLKAIRLAEASGDLTGPPGIAWTFDRHTPYVPSPLLYDGILYFLRSNTGVLSAFDAATGAPHYQLQRLDGVANVFSSPVGAAGRIYISSQEGTTQVIRHGRTFDVLATNHLDDGFDASPALVDDTIYMRGQRYLYAIGE